MDVSCISAARRAAATRTRSRSASSRARVPPRAPRPRSPSCSPRARRGARAARWRLAHAEGGAGCSSASGPRRAVHPRARAGHRRSGAERAHARSRRARSAGSCRADADGEIAAGARAGHDARATTASICTARAPASPPRSRRAAEAPRAPDHRRRRGPRGGRRRGGSIVAEAANRARDLQNRPATTSRPPRWPSTRRSSAGRSPALSVQVEGREALLAARDGRLRSGRPGLRAGAGADHDRLRGRRRARARSSASSARP